MEPAIKQTTAVNKHATHTASIAGYLSPSLTGPLLPPFMLPMPPVPPAPEPTLVLAPGGACAGTVAAAAAAAAALAATASVETVARDATMIKQYSDVEGEVQP